MPMMALEEVLPVARVVSVADVSRTATTATWPEAFLQFNKQAQPCLPVFWKRYCSFHGGGFSDDVFLFWFPLFWFPSLLFCTMMPDGSGC